MLVYFKCLAPKAGERELARIIQTTLGHTLHHETVKALLQRYFFWQYPEFRHALHYPVPAEPEALRLEMQRLHARGWSEKHIAVLLRCHPHTVNKWLRRLKHSRAQAPAPQPTLWQQDLSRAPHHPPRKVYFGAIHATLTLQKKYGYAGWFRIKGYLEEDYGIYFSPATIKKIMALNRRVHLAPVRPVKEPELREVREGPPKSRHPFQHTFIDLRYLDAKPEGVQLYSCLLLEGLSRTILAGSLTPEEKTICDRDRRYSLARGRRGGVSVSRNARLRQNLSFVIRPLKANSGFKRASVNIIGSVARRSPPPSTFTAT